MERHAILPVNQEPMVRDEIYMIDIWRIFLREWKWFLAMLVLVLAITFAFTNTAKRQWEATAWVQIGQVGQAPQGQDPKVESLARILERLQTLSFQNDVLAGIGVSPDSQEGRLYRKSMKLEPLPYAGPLIRMSVRASSPELARQLAEATVAKLREIHRRLEATPLALAHSRLDEIQSDLRNAAAERDRLQQSSTPTEKNAPGPLLASALLASRNDDIHQLQQARGDLILRLSPTYTYETSLVWPVYVPAGQAFPNLALSWGIGLLAGLSLGAFAAVARNAARRSRASVG